MKFLGFRSGQLFLSTAVLAIAKAVVILAVGAVFLNIALVQLAGQFPMAPEGQTEISAIFDGSLFGSIDHSGPRAAGWPDFMHMLFITGGIVTFALIWSTVISFTLGYKLSQKPHSQIWELLSNLTSIASGFPLFIVGIILYQIVVWFLRSNGIDEVPQEGNITTAVIIKMLIGGLTLGSFEGILGDWPRNIRAILTDLQDKAYYLACRARGQSTWGIIMRTVRPFLLDSLPTRVSYLFGASAIVEETLHVKGLGLTLLKAIISTTTPGRMAYRDSMVAGLLMIAVPLLIFIVIRIAERGRMRLGN